MCDGRFFFEISLGGSLLYSSVIDLNTSSIYFEASSFYLVFLMRPTGLVTEDAKKRLALQHPKEINARRQRTLHRTQTSTHSEMIKFVYSSKPLKNYTNCRMPIGARHINSNPGTALSSIELQKA